MIYKGMPLTHFTRDARLSLCDKVFG